MMQRYLLLLAGISMSGLLHAQNPSDGCASVPALTVNASCSAMAYTLPGSYSNGALVTASCFAAGNDRDDGWYSVTATSTGTMTIELDGDQGHTLAVFDACGGGNELGCDQQASGTVATVSFSVTNGVTYYVQVHRNQGNNTADMTGTICAYMGSPSSTHLIGDGDLTSCNGTMFDTGGSGGDYSSSELITETYCSDTPGQCVSITFNSFSTESCCDELTIYDGTSTSDPLIGTYAGSTNPGTITSTNGCLTLVWDSDGSVVYPGWDATITCVTCPTCSDGIQNGSETGVDCGGPSCPACPCSSNPIYNDEACCATVLTVNPDDLCGTVTSGTVANATASAVDQSACFGTEDDDVWFEFVATNSTHYIDILNISGSATDMYHSVWEGSCASPTLVSGSCSDPNSQTLTGLTPGNTYYVRVYTYTSTGGQNTTFDVCIGSPPPPPANDDCSGAIALTVNPDLNCGTVTAGTVSGATASSQASGGCFGTDDDDVWYTFTATNTTHVIELQNVSGSVTDMYHSVWEGNCPALSLVAGSCSDANSQTLTGLTIGDTYYIRVYTYTSTGGQNTTFDVCVGTPPPPPANDDCSGAYVLTVNPTGVCTTVTAGTVASATASTQASGGCFGTDDDDVWFQFTATNTSHYIDLLNVSGSVTDMYHSVWEGNCPALSLVAGSCSDANSQTLTGLTIGDTYYVRVYTYTSTGGQNTNFDVCIGSPPPPPTNDDCVDAISVTVNSDASCTSFTSGYTMGATQSLAGCTGTADDDVWFSFVALDVNQDIQLSNATGTTDLAHELFSGSCGSLTSLGCSDPNTSSYTGLTPGDTYYVRVYTYSSSGANTGFDLCITSPCGISGTPPSCGLDYTYSSIAYDPANYNTGTTVTFTDDRFADAFTSIGFDFCFDGVTYSECLLSSNGYIIFPGCYSAAPTEPNVTAGGYSAYSMYTDAPNTDDAPRNAIMGPWQDIDPSISGSTIRYSTEGVAPNRVFIVKFDAVGMYSCTSLDFSGQIKLFETTNNIEVHIGEKTVCSTWNDGGAILGLHDYSGSTAVIPSGYNYSTQWTVPTNSPEGHLFTNNCDCNVVLPVELSQFDAVASENSNVLQWRTESEENNDYFVIERSESGYQYAALAQVDGMGTTTQATEYRYEHKDPSAVEIYRLRQVDFDGNVHYSKSVTVYRNKSVIAVYPNPTEGQLFLDYTGSKGDITVRYTDVIGHTAEEQLSLNGVAEKKELSGFARLDAGMYVVQIVDASGTVLHQTQVLKK